MNKLQIRLHHHYLTWFLLLENKKKCNFRYKSICCCRCFVKQIIDNERIKKTCFFFLWLVFFTYWIAFLAVYVCVCVHSQEIFFSSTPLPSIISWSSFSKIFSCHHQIIHRDSDNLGTICTCFDFDLVWHFFYVVVVVRKQLCLMIWFSSGSILDWIIQSGR